MHNAKSVNAALHCAFWFVKQMHPASAGHVEFSLLAL